MYPAQYPWKKTVCGPMVFVGASASTMLLSAEFICLRVAYREAFWEELGRLITVIVFGYLILFGIDVVILNRLFLLSFSFNWEDKCTCVYSASNIKDHIPSHFRHLKFCHKFSAVSDPWLLVYPKAMMTIASLWNTVYSSWNTVVKHSISCWMYYTIVTTIVVCYSFKDIRAQLWHIFNLTSRICLGYPFHLGDTLWSASKSLKTYYICNCLAHKHGLVLSKWKV